MSPSRLSRLTFALLLMALALAGVLAHQAQRTARSHRATAERTLRSYAQIAAWAVGNEVRQDLLALNHTTLAPVGRAELGPDGRPLPHAVAPLPQVRDAVTRQERLCGCTLASLGVFWFDFRAGALATDGAALGTPAARRWVTDTLRALVRDMPQTFAPTPIIVRSPQGYPRLLGYTATHLVQASAFGVVDGRPVALVLMVRRTVAGDPVLAFGYATDPQAHVGAVAERVLRKRGLLPPVLLGGDAAPIRCSRCAWPTARGARCGVRGWPSTRATRRWTRSSRASARCGCTSR
jgi:hypothetical protein